MAADGVCPRRDVRSSKGGWRDCPGLLAKFDGEVVVVVVSAPQRYTVPAVSGGHNWELM